LNLRGSIRSWTLRCFGRVIPLEAAAAVMVESAQRSADFVTRGRGRASCLQNPGTRRAALWQARTTLVIDDRADIAMLLGAGLHVGQDDLPPGEARRLIGPDAILDTPTHNKEQLIARRGAGKLRRAGADVCDSVQAKSRSGRGSRAVGGVETVDAAAPRRDGGITRANAAAVLAAGADSVAVIGDLYPATARRRLRERMRDWHRTIGDSHE